jgi:hypothetical protein
MCWYSQQEKIDTRKAIEGEELIVHDFPNHGRWLASPREIEKPVCIQNGCKLRISNIPQNLQKELKIASEAIGEFKEIYQKHPASLIAKLFLPPRLCFDAVVFPSGKALEISRFSPNTKVDVLSEAIVAPLPKTEAVETREFTFNTDL